MTWKNPSSTFSRMIKCEPAVDFNTRQDNQCMDTKGMLQRRFSENYIINRIFARFGIWVHITLSSVFRYAVCNCHRTHLMCTKKCCATLTAVFQWYKSGAFCIPCWFWQTNKLVKFGIEAHVPKQLKSQTHFRYQHKNACFIDHYMFRSICHLPACSDDFGWHRVMGCCLNI